MNIIYLFAVLSQAMLKMFASSKHASEPSFVCYWLITALTTSGSLMRRKVGFLWFQECNRRNGARGVRRRQTTWRRSLWVTSSLRLF